MLDHPVNRTFYESVVRAIERHGARGNGVSDGDPEQFLFIRTLVVIEMRRQMPDVGSLILVEAVPSAINRNKA